MVLVSRGRKHPSKISEKNLQISRFLRLLELDFS